MAKHKLKRVRVDRSQLRTPRRFLVVGIMGVLLCLFCLCCCCCLSRTAMSFTFASSSIARVGRQTHNCRGDGCDARATAFLMMKNLNLNLNRHDPPPCWFYPIPRRPQCQQHPTVRSKTIMSLRMVENVDSSASSENTFKKNRNNNNSMMNINARQKIRSLAATIDEVGLSLKPRAERAVARLAATSTTATLINLNHNHNNTATTTTTSNTTFSRRLVNMGCRIQYFLQIVCLYSLFILYRAYRGVFIILPAVFRKVYEQLDRAIDSTPFEGNNNNNNNNDGGAIRLWTAQEANDPVMISKYNMKNEQPQQPPPPHRLRRRTRVTISVLASIVTLSYAVRGAGRVAARFMMSLVRTTSVPESFQAAAREQEANERTILRRVVDESATGPLNIHRINHNAADTHPINGTSDEESDSGKRNSNLAP